MNNYEESPNLCPLCGDTGVYLEEKERYVCKCEAGTDYWLQCQLDREMRKLDVDQKEMTA